MFLLHPSAIIVLMNGYFYNGPVICPRSVITVEEVCNGPRQRRGPLQTSEVIITDQGHITGPLQKHPFLNIFINQLKKVYVLLPT